MKFKQFVDAILVGNCLGWLAVIVVCAMWALIGTTCYTRRMGYE